MDNVTSVNQGGFLLRKYMSDLGTFVDSENGVCVEEKRIAHALGRRLSIDFLFWKGNAKVIGWTL